MKLVLTKKLLLLAYFHSTKLCYVDHWHWGESSAVFPVVSLVSYPVTVAHECYRGNQLLCDWIQVLLYRRKHMFDTIP